MAGQLHHIVSYEIKQTPDFLRRSLLYPPRQSFDKWTVCARTIKSKLPMFCGIHDQRASFGFDLRQSSCCGSRSHRALHLACEWIVAARI